MKKKRILVVDDERGVRQSLVHEIRQAGYDVAQADNGERALHFLIQADAKGISFDLLISDMQMPVLSGLEMVEKLREQGVNTPVLAISGHGTQDIISGLSRLGGCVGFVVKPFSPGEIIERVRQILSRQASSANRAGPAPRDAQPASPPQAPSRQTQLDVLEFITSFSTELNSMLEDPSLVLPVLPGAALQVRRTVMAEENTFEQIAKVVSQEPALSARLLQVANSPVYAGLKRVRTLSDAVGRLGLEEVCNILQAVLTRLAFKTNVKGLTQIMQELWVHSICTAYANEMVGQVIKVPPNNDLFMMGLLHDIGKLLILHLVQVGVAEKRWKEEEVSRDILIPFFAMRHNDLGARLMQNWDYPEPFQQVARLHNDVKNISRHPESVVVTYFSNILARKLGCSTVPFHHSPQEDKALISALNINAATYEKIEAAVAGVTQRVKESCLCVPPQTKK